MTALSRGITMDRYDLDQLIKWLSKVAVEDMPFVDGGMHKVCKLPYLLARDRDYIVRVLEAIRGPMNAPIS